MTDEPISPELRAILRSDRLRSAQTVSADPGGAANTTSTEVDPKAIRRAQVDFLRRKIDSRSARQPLSPPEGEKAETDRLFPDEDEGVLNELLDTLTWRPGPEATDGPPNNRDSTSSVYSQLTQQDQNSFEKYMLAAFDELEKALDLEGHTAHNPYTGAETDNSVLLGATQAMKAARASWMSSRRSSAVLNHPVQTDDFPGPSSGSRPEPQSTAEQMYHDIMKEKRTAPSPSVNEPPQSTPGESSSVVPSYGTSTDSPVDPSTFPEPKSPTSPRRRLRTLTRRVSQKFGFRKRLEPE